MKKHFEYAGKIYADRAAADAAITEFLLLLGTRPTEWCVVKEVSRSSDGSFTIPADSLSDEEISTISGPSLYQFTSHITGENVLGATAPEVADLVASARVSFIDWMRAWSLYAVEEIGAADIGLSRYQTGMGV